MCPTLYRSIFNILYASEISFGAGLALSKLDKTKNYKVIALYETKTGSLVDNIYPVGGKLASKTTKSSSGQNANSSPSTNTTITAECLSAFRAAGLAQHNTLRAKHGAQIMKQSSVVDASALAYAQVLAANGGNLVHSKTSYGENLWYSSDGSNMNLAKCTRIICFSILFYS